MSTTFTNRALTCIISRTLNVYSDPAITVPPSLYSTAYAAAAAYDLTTILWGKEHDIIYAADGTTTTTDESHFDLPGSLGGAVGYNVPKPGTFTRACNYGGSGILGTVSTAILFQLQLCDVLLFCPCHYCVPDFPWGGWTPLADYYITTCADFTAAVTTVPSTGVIIHMTLPALATPPIPAPLCGGGGAVWKFLRLGAHCPHENAPCNPVSNLVQSPNLPEPRFVLQWAWDT